MNRDSFDNMEINTLSDILATKYQNYTIRYIAIHIRKLFDKLHENNLLFSSQDLTTLIKFLCKGLSRSYISLDKSGKILSTITRRYIPDNASIALIIKSISINSEFKWVDNLIALGHEFRPEQYRELLIKGYSKSVEKIMVQESGTSDDLHSICKARPFSLDDMHHFLLKFKIKPDYSHFLNIIQHSHYKSKNTEYNYGNNVIYIDDIINVLLDCGMQLTVPFIEYICQTVLISIEINPKINNAINEYFANKHIHSLSELTHLFKLKNSYYNNNILANIYHIVYFSNVYQLEKYPNIFLDLCRQTKKDTQLQSYIRIYSEYSKIIHYLYHECKYDVSINILEAACLAGDEILFEETINIGIYITHQCLINACVSSNKLILEALINMKALPDIDCVKALRESDISIMNILLDNGLHVSHEVIKCAINNNIIIYNLETYGIEYDTALYSICHDTQRLKNEYISHFTKNKLINIHLRTLITNTGSQEEIIDAIKRDKYADYMMYDDAVRFDLQQVVAYLEDNYNMKPNLHTLCLIPDLDIRQKYVERIKILYPAGNIPYNT